MSIDISECSQSIRARLRARRMYWLIATTLAIYTPLFLRLLSSVNEYISSLGEIRDAASTFAILIGISVAMLLASWYFLVRNLIVLTFAMLHYSRRLLGPSIYRQWRGSILRRNQPFVISDLNRILQALLHDVDKFRQHSRGARFVLRPQSAAGAIGNFVIMLASLGIGIAGIFYIMTHLFSLPVLFKMFLVLPFLGIGFSTLYWARRFRANLHPSASKLQLADNRPVVLWLRSFEDDKQSFAHRSTAREEALPAPWEGGPLEEILAVDLWYYGPVVAVGAPGDPLPNIGAARGYFPDDKWQEAVRSWMATSRIIVVVVGSTEWLKWEVKTLVEDGHLAKTLFIFPAGSRAANSIRWSRAISDLKGPEHEIMAALDVDPALCVVQRRNGQFQVIGEATTGDEVSYQLATRIAAYCLFCEGTSFAG